VWVDDDAYWYVAEKEHIRKARTTMREPVYADLVEPKGGGVTEEDCKKIAKDTMRDILEDHANRRLVRGDGIIKWNTKGNTN
jgi:hypothetical protein